MGSPPHEPSFKPHEGPQHQVQITRPFYMGITEITQKQWVSVMGTEPWYKRPHVTEGHDYPATYISWNDAVEFCRVLSEKTGQKYRLPTEAEWEYACRAGTTTAWHFGDDLQDLDAHGWLYTNTILVRKRFAHEVGLKEPNPFGLYDMHGNLYEWCEDFFVSDTYARRTGVTRDPVVKFSQDGDQRHITRGGAFDTDGFQTRSALRGMAHSKFLSERDGLRVVRECSIPPQVPGTTTPAANAPKSP